MTKLAKVFAKNLSRLLEERGAKSDLARMLGVTPAQITHYTNGSQSPNLETLEQIAGALRVRVQDLLEDKGSDAAASKAEISRAYDLVREDLKKKFVADGFGWPPDLGKLFSALSAYLKK